MSEAIELAPWPGGAQTSVSLTFDVDAETGLLGDGPEYARRLSSLSEGRFGIARGLGRILSLLDRLQVPATFYVPGHTAELHPSAVVDILAGGHEIGHHGHMHLRSDTLNAGAQRAELERGTVALAAAGATPRGYRSPSWELTPETFALLVELGFAYDSSCMGDDRPYYERHEELEILELPVHWSLDDWPHFAWHPGGNEMLTAPNSFVDTFLGEFDVALAEGRHVTYTMHPEVIGRGYRMALLERIVTEIQSRGRVWFATHGQIERHIADGDSGPSLG